MFGPQNQNLLKMLGIDTGASKELPLNYQTVVQTPISLPKSDIHATYVSKNPKWQPMKNWNPDKPSKGMAKIDMNSLFQPDKEDMGDLKSQVDHYRSVARLNETQMQQLENSKYHYEEHLREAQQFGDMEDELHCLDTTILERQVEQQQFENAARRLEEENRALQNQLHSQSMHVPAQVHYNPPKEVIYRSPAREVIYEEPKRVSYQQYQHPVSDSTVRRVSHSGAHQASTVIRAEPRIVNESQPTRVIRQTDPTRVSHTSHSQVVGSHSQGNTVRREPITRSYRIDADGNRLEVDNSHGHQSNTSYYNH